MPQTDKNKFKKSQPSSRFRQPWINRNVVDPVENLSRRVTGRPLGLPRAKPIEEPYPFSNIRGKVTGRAEESRDINKPISLPDFEEKVGPIKKRSIHYKEPS